MTYLLYETNRYKSDQMKKNWMIHFNKKFQEKDTVHNGYQMLVVQFKNDYKILIIFDERKIQVGY